MSAWQRVWARWFGRPDWSATLFAQVAAAPLAGHPGRLEPLFGADFLWPIRPRRIARWAREHAVHQRRAPAARHRRLAADPHLQRLQRDRGAPHDVVLSAMTAAVSLGGRRLRVLVAPNGEVLGPRALDPVRVAAAAATAALAMGLAGAITAHLLAPAKPAAGPALAAEAAPPAASVAAPAEAAAAHSGREPREGRANTAAMPEPVEHDPDPASAHTRPPPVAGADAMAHAPTEPTRIRPASISAGDHGSTARPAADTHDRPLALVSSVAPSRTATARANEPPYAPATTAATQPSSALPSPVAAPPAFTTQTPPPPYPRRRASEPLAQIRPQLSDAERTQAKALSEAARQARSQASTPAGSAAAGPSPAAGPAPSSPTAPPAPQGKFALVITGGPTREPAEASLAQMVAVRSQLKGNPPSRSEVVQQHGLWHAAQWPFADQADAEQARALLATRGLTAKIVPF